MRLTTFFRLSLPRRVAPRILFVAQQRKRLRIENLPRITSGLGEDDPSILGISVVSKVGALIDKALAIRVHYQAEGIAVRKSAWHQLSVSP